MSQLFPDVTLDEDEPLDRETSSSSSSEEATKSDENKELQNDSSTALSSETTRPQEQNDSSTALPNGESSSTAARVTEARRKDAARRRPEERPTSPPPPRLQTHPSERPDLNHKIGPYVSEEVDDALEEAYLLLRRRFGASASKSLIVEVALRFTLADCLGRTDDSALVKWLEDVLPIDS